MLELLSILLVDLISGVILLYIEYRWFVNNRDNK